MCSAPSAPAGAAANSAPSAPAGAAANEFNWRVVVYMHAAGLAICLVFAAITFLEVSEQLDGAWLIFAPFGPSLLYALHKDWLQRASIKASAKQKDE